jgi:RimJ/RimL family protein N-acetyltransferase
MRLLINGITKPHFLVSRIQRHIEHDGIGLRPLRIADVPLIRNGLPGKDVSGSGAPGNLVSPSCLRVWWWLKKTYKILFSIEVASKCVGFIGLYNLERESAEVTLLIIDSRDRRRGYASRAYNAVDASLSRSSFFKRIIVRVRADNHPSLSFWKKLGFDELHTGNGITTMAKDLKASE